MKLLPCPWHWVPGCSEAWCRAGGLRNDGRKLGSCAQVGSESSKSAGGISITLASRPVAPTITVTSEISQQLLSTSFMARAGKDMVECAGRPCQARLSADPAEGC